MNRPLWHEAAALAARAHRNQIRKDGMTPYAAHPARVALIAATIFGCDDEKVLAAALLHDVIEDCDCDYDDVAEACGREVADIVAALTKDMRMVEPERERAYDAQLAAGPWEARLLKLADVYDNLSDADTVARKRSFIERASRALVLAEGDARLAGPAERVRELVAAARAELEAG